MKPTSNLSEPPNSGAFPRANLSTGVVLWHLPQQSKPSVLNGCTGGIKITGLPWKVRQILMTLKHYNSSLNGGVYSTITKNKKKTFTESSYIFPL